MVKKVFLLLSWKLLGKLWQIVSYDPTMREQFPGCELLFRRKDGATRRTATSGKIRENVDMRIKKIYIILIHLFHRLANLALSLPAGSKAHDSPYQRVW